VRIPRRRGGSANGARGRGRTSASPDVRSISIVRSCDERISESDRKDREGTSAVFDRAPGQRLLSPDPVIRRQSAERHESSQSRHSAAPAATPAHSPKASLSQSLEGALSGHLVKRLAVLLR
jgi:hypothetical protein